MSGRTINMQKYNEEQKQLKGKMDSRQKLEGKELHEQIMDTINDESPLNHGDNKEYFFNLNENSSNQKFKQIEEKERIKTNKRGKRRKITDRTYYKKRWYFLNY